MALRQLVGGLGLPGAGVGLVGDLGLPGAGVGLLGAAWRWGRASLGQG